MTTTTVGCVEAEADRARNRRQNLPRHADLGAGLRRRADAARRLGSIDGRHGGLLAALDPALTWPPAPRQPSTFGLAPDERRREVERMVATGWYRWEIVAVLVSPTVAA